MEQFEGVCEVLPGFGAEFAGVFGLIEPLGLEERLKEVASDRKSVV